MEVIVSKKKTSSLFIMESTPSAPHSADTTACDTLIKITVKTLDSRNHDFVGLPASMTIRDLKSRIAPAVGIEAVRQRLIYCGRVLQDDKKLSEYDVDGKVIHLVQRPPPSTNPRDGSGGTRQGGKTVDKFCGRSLRSVTSK